MNRSIGDNALVFGACLFGSWTVLCYVMVFSESGFSDLKMWSFVPVVIGLGIGSLCSGKFLSTDACRLEGMARPILISGAHSWSARALLVMTISSIILRMAGAPYWSIWIVLLSASVLVLRNLSTVVAQSNEVLISGSNWQKAGFVALAIFGALLVAITHRPDPDDAQYLNFVVTAMDFPFEPLFSHSGLWQDQRVPLELPIYRFHTYELLVATLSEISGVDHKALYYLILAPIFGGVAMLVHWRLAQHLVPQNALPILLAWLVLIIALGESHREFGNFAFVRLYQGKGLLVTVGLPLCLLLGLQFAEAPDGRRALTLGMAVIASIGFSSSALATAPLVVAAALSGGLLGASRTPIKLIVVGGFASLFVLIAIGLVLVMTMNTGGTGVYGDALPGTGGGLSVVLGEGLLGAMVLALFPVAPLFIANYKRKRIYATTTLFLVIAVLNPWITPFLARMLDSALQWRLFWSVPFVMSAAISLTGLAVLAADNLPRAARHAALPVMLVAVLLISSQWSISPSNQVVIKFPGFKAEPAAHALAAEIVRDAPQRSTIYAPTSIAALITTFRLHPYPLIVRPEYLGFEHIRNHFGDSELGRREHVIRFLEGYYEQPYTIAYFKAQLEIDRPTFIVYKSQVEKAAEIGSVLQAAGYVGEKRGLYWLWQLP
jgi:hypothetical protein